MPGILGIINRQPPGERRSMLDTMINCMLHESFYSSGVLANDEMGIAIGWVCHKGSYCDCLPSWNETGDVCLIFSGEHFGDPEEFRQLRARGHSFNAGNASSLVHLYEEYGDGFIDKINGWFSGVLIDLRRGKAVLFNDRYGLNRIYLHEDGRSVFFASEAKSLLKVLPALRRLDARSLAERLCCGCVLQNRTLFSGVAQLPGASRWTFSRGQLVSKESYFRPATWEAQEPLPPAQYYGKLKDVFPHSLQRYFRAENQMGMSLTGGLDSRMIMAWAGLAPGSLPCYTFGSAYRDGSDVRVARKLANACQQPYHVIPVNGDFLGRFPSLAERAVYLSDGTMDVTGSVELYVNQVAREIAPIRLTGNYGSEILRGNIAFKPTAASPDVFEDDFGVLMREARETYARELEGNRLSFIAFKQVPWHHYSRLSIEQSQMTVRAPYLDNDLVRLAFQALAEALSSKEPCLRLIAEANASLAGIPTDRGDSYPGSPLLGPARRLVQEFTSRAEYAYDVGMPQWLSRFDHAFGRFHLERLFLGRHKFYHFRIWYREPLAKYLKEVLLDPRTRNRAYLDGVRLEQMVEAHVSGVRNHTSELHQLLTTEIIQRQFLEQN